MLVGHDAGTYKEHADQPDFASHVAPRRQRYGRSPTAMVLFPLDRTVLVHREHVDAKQRAEAVRDMQCPLFVRLEHPSSATITPPVARQSSVVVC